MKPLIIAVVAILAIASLGFSFYIYQRTHTIATPQAEDISVFSTTTPIINNTVVIATSTIVSPASATSSFPTTDDLMKKTVISPTSKTSVTIIGTNAPAATSATSTEQAKRYTDAYNAVVTSYNGVITAMQPLQQTLQDIGKAYGTGGNDAVVALLPKGESQSTSAKARNVAFKASVDRWKTENSAVASVTVRTAGGVIGTTGTDLSNAFGVYLRAVDALFAYRGGDMTSINADLQSAANALTPAGAAFTKAVTDFNALLKK